MKSYCASARAAYPIKLRCELILYRQRPGSLRGGECDLSQSDFYELFAYGMKYLGGAGDTARIYPSHARLETRLWVLKPEAWLIRLPGVRGMCSRAYRALVDRRLRREGRLS